MPQAQGRRGTCGRGHTASPVWRTVVWAALVSCHSPPLVPIPGLAGSWQLELALDSGAPAAQLHPSSQIVIGSVTIADTLLRREDVDSGGGNTPVHVGAYEVDVSPFFGTLSSRDSLGRRPPNPFQLSRQLIAYRTKREHVGIAFDPEMSHPTIWLEGVLAGDSIIGLWRQGYSGAAAYGTFRMVREQ